MKLAPLVRTAFRRAMLAIVSIVVGCSWIDCAWAAPPYPAAKFETQVAPLLIKRCLECHQGSDPSGGLSLTTAKALAKGGDSGEVIDSKRPMASLLLQRVREGEMPPDRQGKPQPLTKEETEILEQWVNAGAAFPEQRELDWFERTNDQRAGRDWWSLQPIRHPKPPQLESSAQKPVNDRANTMPVQPIDAFVLARLHQAGLTPAPLADRATLLRRLYFDLTGLPPTRKQLTAFVNDRSANAWEKQVDRLLATPQYGERWGRHWLDLVRYAETSGYERDQEKPFAWKYRDWVIQSLNEDMPYDRFLIEQLAGDELPDRSESAVVATGFLRLGTWNDEPNDPADYQYDRLEDLVHATSTAFLGMTVKCARCHSHKFDPITQEDYYRMGSAFWSGPVAARKRDLLGGPSADELGFPKVLGWTDIHQVPPPLHVLKNGERNHPLQEAKPASLSMVPQLERDFKAAPAEAKTTHRRLQLAQWMTDPRHPLTARVIVNRLWQHHFGKAIVRTPNNFGFLADPPTHPDLLDWLASELVEGGWRLKPIHKAILMSKTWRRSSLHPKWKACQTVDAANRLWWRAERRRRDAESLRDSMLAVSGELDLSKAGGPSFRPTISDEALEGLSRKSSAWKASPPDEQNRRSVYAFMKRGLLPPMMTTFDLCDSTLPCGQRDATTVPTQALTMMNNRFAHRRSEFLAVDVERAGTAQSAVIRGLWRRVYQRDPSDEELRWANTFVTSQRQKFANPSKPSPTPGSPGAADPSAKLVLHLRADRQVTVEEGRVKGWQNLANAKRHHASQPRADARPVLIRDDTSRDPAAIEFDGRSRFLHVDGKLLDRDEFTIVAVASDAGRPGHREILSNWNGGLGNSTSSVFLGLTNEATVRFSDAFHPKGKVTDRSKLFILSANQRTSEAAVFQNGRLLGKTSPLTGRNLDTPWVIGQQGNIQGEYWQGRICEIRVYQPALAPTALRQLERQLGKQYQIAIADSSPSEATVNSTKRLTPRQLAYAALAHVLFNSNEFLYVD